jgi:hypothetical protein
MGVVNRLDLMHGVQIKVEPLDAYGGEPILPIYTNHLADDINPKKLGELTSNFMGAEVDGAVDE